MLENFHCAFSPGPTDLPLGLSGWGLYGWYIILSNVLDLPVTVVLLVLLFDLFL